MSKECMVILDSSSLLQVYDGLDVIDLLSDVLGRCEFFVLDSIIGELINLSTTEGFKGRAASLALHYIRLRGIKVINTVFKGLPADLSLIRFFKSDPSLRNKYVVATNDVELRSKLLKLGVKVVTWWPGKHRYILIEP